MNLPLIDVVIPCYNTEQTLARAVESVLQQNNLGHLWLIDDASTDNTFALALQLAKQYPDRISVEQMPKNSGVAMARNGAQCSLLKVRSILLHFLERMMHTNLEH